MRLRRRSAVRELLRRFANPLVAILLLASAASALLKDTMNAGLVLCIVAVSVVVDFVQTRRSQQAADGLRAQVAESPWRCGMTNPWKSRDTNPTQPMRRFMLWVGPVSSFYDFLTFFVLLTWFHSMESSFHTGWFVESLATQTLVIFVIRTAKNPLRRPPSHALVVTTFSVVALGLSLPWSPFARALGFVPLPAAYFGFLAVATATYLVIVEIVKRWALRGEFN